MPFRFLCSRCLPKALCHLLMMCSNIAVAAVLVNLLGWHWEFLPAFAAELVPGVDLVPFWTLAVISVYRKWKQITIPVEETREQRPALKGQQNSS